MVSLIYNEYLYYNFNPKRNELKNNTNYFRIANQRCGYQDIAKWLSCAFAFSAEVQQRWKQKLSEKLIQESFSYSERYYLLRSLLGCLFPLPFSEDYNIINFNRKENHASINQQKNFDFVGYKIKLESMYHILNDKVLFNYDNCLIREEKIFYSRNGRVLNVELNVTQEESIPPLNKSLTHESNSKILPQTGWKQVRYDNRVSELFSARHILDLETVYYLRNLCESVSTWHDYIGENRKELRIVEKEQLLFKNEEKDFVFLKKCFDCINGEYLKLLYLISEKKETNLQRAFKLLIEEGKLTEQHIRILKKYWDHYSAVICNHSIDVNIETDKLKCILFDCKLLYFLTQCLRDNMVKRNIQEMLQCSPIKQRFDYNSVTYSELEEYVLDKVLDNDTLGGAKIWETITLREDDSNNEYTPEEFYLLKGKNPEVSISNNLFLAYCYHGLIKTDINKDYKKAFNYLLKSAEAEEVLSMELLGDYFYFGIGSVKKDYSRAFYYYKKASVHKWCGHATYMVGECYYFGKGIKRDFSIALKYFEKAASSNVAPALLATIACYINNEGTQEKNNFAKIHEYLWQASNMGLDVSSLNMVVNEMENSSISDFSKFKVVFALNKTGLTEYRILKKR